MSVLTYRNRVTRGRALVAAASLVCGSGGCQAPPEQQSGLSDPSNWSSLSGLTLPRREPLGHGTSSAENFAALKSFVSQQEGFRGAVAISGLELTTYFGQGNIGVGFGASKQRPLDGSEFFPIGSLAKTITGPAAIRALGNKLELPISELGVDLPLPIDHPLRSASIGQLLRHQGGIILEGRPKPKLNPNAAPGGDRLMDVRWAGPELFGQTFDQNNGSFAIQPGTRIAYSNAGYAFTAYIIGCLRDRNQPAGAFTDFVSKAIIPPACKIPDQSHRSQILFWGDPVIWNDNRVVVADADATQHPSHEHPGFRAEIDRIPNWHHLGCNGVLATAPGVAAYLRALLTPGAILSEAELGTMLTPGRTGYGIGCSIHPLPQAHSPFGQIAVSKTGSDRGGNYSAAWSTKGGGIAVAVMSCVARPSGRGDPNQPDQAHLGYLRAACAASLLLVNDAPTLDQEGAATPFVGTFSDGENTVRVSRNRDRESAIFPTRLDFDPGALSAAVWSCGADPRFPLEAERLLIEQISAVKEGRPQEMQWQGFVRGASGTPIFGPLTELLASPAKISLCGTFPDPFEDCYRTFVRGTGPDGTVRWVSVISSPDVKTGKPVMTAAKDESGPSARFPWTSALVANSGALWTFDSQHAPVARFSLIGPDALVVEVGDKTFVLPRSEEVK